MIRPSATRLVKPVEFGGRAADCQAYKHGVLISAGTDSFAPSEDPYPALQGEIEILVQKVGMTPMDALRSATIISAMSMGQEADMGTLESGKLANIGFLSGDPLQNIAAIKEVTLTVNVACSTQERIMFQ